MNRIPPSERIQKQIDDLFHGNWQTKEDLVGKLIMLGTQHLAQEMLEQEVTDYLGRGHYERREEGQEHQGYRNTCCTQYSVDTGRRIWIPLKGVLRSRCPRCVKAQNPIVRPWLTS